MPQCGFHNNASTAKFLQLQLYQFKYKKVATVKKSERFFTSSWFAMHSLDICHWEGEWGNTTNNLQSPRKSHQNHKRFLQNVCGGSNSSNIFHICIIWNIEQMCIFIVSFSVRICTHDVPQLSNLWWMHNSSKQRFWHCHENGPIKTIQTIPVNL